MSDELERLLWDGAELPPKKEESPEKRVEIALQRALDSTTVEEAGTPWGAKEERRNDGSGRIPESTCEE